MIYRTFGPFNLETKTDRWNAKRLDFDSRTLQGFWEKATTDDDKLLRTARGVYVFAGKRSWKHIPWYVGQSKTGFENEVFSLDKINKYQEAYSHNMTAEIATIFLIARMTPTGRLANTIPTEEADFVEQEIIRHALNVNGDLINRKNTKFTKTMVIDGIMNSEPEWKDATKKLRRMLGLRGTPNVYTEKTE